MLAAGDRVPTTARMGATWPAAASAPDRKAGDRRRGGATHAERDGDLRMYNATGDWVSAVGMPAKSGVGGGIVAVLPGQLGIGVYSPLLDARATACAGFWCAAILPNGSACTS